MRRRLWPLLLGGAIAALLAAQSAAPAGRTTFDIRGRGWGHGVGLSQYGAEGFARHGFLYPDILSYYYRGTALGRARDARVRVLLQDGSTGVQVGSLGAVAVHDAGGRAFTIPAGRYDLDPSFVLAAVGRRVRLRPPVRFDPVNAPLRLAGRGYRGSIVLARDGGGLSVIDDVPVELYLRGVVPSEMPADWHREALRAQAVAARTYALRAIRPDRSFDLYPDTRSQVYGGIAAEDAASTRAVDATAGVVVTWHGRLAATFYHSTSGGCTAASSDGMPGAERLPYLVATPDPFDRGAPEHRWGPLMMSGPQLGARLGLPAVTSVSIARNGSGRVASVTAAYDGGERTLSGSAVARALGLPSTWFNVALRGSVEDANVPVDCAGAARSTPRAPPLAAVVAPRTQADDPGAAAPRAPSSAGADVRSASVVPLVSAVRGVLWLGVVVGAVCDLLERIRTAPIQEPAETVAHPTVPPPPLTRLPSVAVPARAAAPSSAQSSAATPSTTPATPSPPAPPAPPPPPPPASAPVAPPPPEPLEIQDVTLLALDASSARISWRTSFPATAVAGFGLNRVPTRWATPGPLEFTHETELAALRPDSKYGLWLQATDAWGRSQTAELELNTPAAGPLVSVVTRAGAVLTANGAAFFPLVEWNACPDRFADLLATGFNLFMGLDEGCGARAGFGALAGKATFVVPAGGPPAEGSIGTYLPDELDGRLSGDAVGQVAALPPPDPARLTFLNLTNHFYSRAEPLPIGRDVYPPLVTKADVLSFDLYPLQEWCKATAVGDVFDAQRELVQLAAGKPTYQWIEARDMKCHAPEDAVTPASVRAETWLAIAGGAHGIGYFPNNWRDDVGAEIARTITQINDLAPALLADPADAASDVPAVRVGARMLNGALYVVAVNAGWSGTAATLRVPELHGRSAAVYDEARTVAPTGDDTFTDTFQPLEAHIYVVAPQGWTTVSP